MRLNVLQRNAIFCENKGLKANVDRDVLTRTIRGRGSRPLCIGHGECRC